MPFDPTGHPRSVGEMMTIPYADSDWLMPDSLHSPQLFHMLSRNPPFLGGGEQMPYFTCGHCGRSLPAVVFFDALNNQYSSLCRQCTNFLALCT